MRLASQSRSDRLLTFSIECSIPAPTTVALPLSDGLSFQAFPLSHGLDPSAFHCSPSKLKQDPPAPPECYDSTAFFVKEEVTGEGYEMLFFGDVEPGIFLALIDFQPAPS